MKKIFLSLPLSLMFASVVLAAGMPGTNITTAQLNVRASAAIDNNIVGSLDLNQQVDVLKVVGDWCQIQYKDQPAYVSCAYLNPQNSTSQTPTSSSQPSSETIPPSVALANCASLPIQQFPVISPNESEMKVVNFPVCKGWRYLACTQSPAGNPDLYGGATPPTSSVYAEKSTDGSMDDGTGNQVPRPDCIKFEPHVTGNYYLGVYGAAPNSSASIWISSSRKDNIPGGFRNSLTWFSDTCSHLTDKPYGTFNSPWGNDGNPDRPFYQDYNDFIHGGTDIACPENTPVKAMCDGVIKRADDAGGGWGWYTDLECTQGKNTITIAYIHVNQASVLPEGTQVKTGQTIGTVFPMRVPGEVDHLHLTGCNRPYQECDAAGFKPQRGAARRTEWWGVSHFWFDMDWRSNPGLYKSLPVAQ